MSATASALMLGAGVVIAIGSVGVWWALRRPDKSLQRRRRVEALAAAQQVSPAPRVSPYGAAPAAALAAGGSVSTATPVPDPCAPGLNDQQRVAAMRELLLRGDERHQVESPVERTAVLPIEHEAEEVLSTTPMAWQPTRPAEGTGFDDTNLELEDHEHVTL